MVMDMIVMIRRALSITPYHLSGARASGKLHKDYTVYEDVKSILPIYIHVYPVRPCRDDLCEIIPSL